jgi:hypothetical protein
MNQNMATRGVILSPVTLRVPKGLVVQLRTGSAKNLTERSFVYLPIADQTQDDNFQSIEYSIRRLL